MITDTIHIPAAIFVTIFQLLFSVTSTMSTRWICFSLMWLFSTSSMPHIQLTSTRHRGTWPVKYIGQEYGYYNEPTVNKTTTAICTSTFTGTIYNLLNSISVNAVLMNRTEQNRGKTEQDRTGQERTGQGRTEQDKTEQDRTEQDKKEQNRTEQKR